jgi:ribosomal protein S27AE
MVTTETVQLVLEFDYPQWNEDGDHCPRCGEEVDLRETLDHNIATYHCPSCHLDLEYVGFDADGEYEPHVEIHLWPKDAPCDLCRKQ